MLFVVLILHEIFVESISPIREFFCDSALKHDCADTTGLDKSAIAL